MSREDGQLVVRFGPTLSRAAPGHREPDPELVTVAAVVGADELDDPAVLELPAQHTRAEVERHVGGLDSHRLAVSQAQPADATDAGRRAEIRSRSDTLTWA